MQHAVAAKMALDGQPAPSVTGSKPMVIRYQKDTSTVPANLGMAGGKSMSRWDRGLRHTRCAQQRLTTHACVHCPCAQHV